MLSQKIKSLGTFFNTALEDYRHVASLFPSSAHAARAVARHLEPHYHTVVEFGPGNGCITRKILERLPPTARLVAVEINEKFVHELRNIEDPRLSVVHGDVADWAPQMASLFPQGVDAVVSGIPFSYLPHPEREQIVASTRAALGEGGKCIVYQVSDSVAPNLRQHFPCVETFHELRNLPPYLILVGKVGQEEIT